MNFKHWFSTLGIALVLSLRATAAQSVVLQVDVTDPSHVIISAVPGGSMITDHTFTNGAGASLLAFFPAGLDFDDIEMVSSNLKPAQSSIKAYDFFAINPISGTKALNLFTSDDASEIQDFVTGATAFTGTAVLDLSAFSASLPLAGSGGDVVSGDRSGASAVLGQYVVVANPPVPPEIVAAWKSADGKSLLVFRHDGIYYHIQDSASEPGMERGTFVWNKTSGAFFAKAQVDTNGENGLSHPLGATTVSIAGDTLTYSVAGEGSYTCSRVVNTASAIVGSWFMPGERLTVTFLADGTYFHAGESDDAPSGYDGMERGTYTWDSGSAAFAATASTDTNGETGISGASGTATITGNTLFVVDGGVTNTLRRLASNSTPLPLPGDFVVTKFANYGQSSNANPTLSSGDEYWGEAWIEFTGLTAPTLQIGGQVPRAFVDEGDSYSIETIYSTKAQLDAATAFPDGANYVFKSGTATATVNYPAGGVFPAVPKLIATDGTWSGSTYVLGPNETLTWSGHTSYNPAIHYSMLSVEDTTNGAEVMKEYIIQGDLTSVDLRGKLVPGRNYYVTVEHKTLASTTSSGTGGFAGKRGYATYNSNTNFHMRAYQAAAAKPAITCHPVSGTVAAGTAVILSTAANTNAYPAPLCQWFKNNVALPGQTGNSLALYDFQAADAGDYTAKFTNSAGSATSNPAQLVLGAVPVVEYVLVNKSKQYLQTGPTTVILDPRPLGPFWGGPYGFSAQVRGTALASLPVPTVTPPAGTPNTPQDPFYSKLSYDSEDESWRYGPNANDWGGTSQAGLDSKFPNGTYTFHVSGESIPITLSGDAYPNTPQFTLSGGTWVNGKYAMDAANSLSVTTNAFTEYSSHVNGRVDLWLNDFEIEYFADANPSNNFVTHTVPAGTLSTDQMTWIDVEFGAIMQATPVLDEATAIAVYGKNTRFEVFILPKITAQAASRTVSPGGSTTLQVTATGTPVTGTASLNYQWWRGTTQLVGQTGSTLDLTNFQAANAGAYTCVVSNEVGTTTSQSILVELADAYQGYISGYGLNSVTTGAPEVDYDKDGVSNLLEFVLGGNPALAGTAILPTLTSTPITGGRNLVFSYRRRLAAAGIAQGVEYATSLAAAWTPAVHGQNGVLIATTPVDANTQQVTVTIPVVGGRAFARLKATR
jgi:hypothetical protein